MPKYSSSLVNGSAPGVRTEDNVANRLILKDNVVSTEGRGFYPTDSERGMGTLTDETTTLVDFAAIINILQTELDNYETALAAGGFSAAEKKLAVMLNLQHINQAQDHLQEAAWIMKNLTDKMNGVASSGVLATSRYPSGRNRGF